MATKKQQQELMDVLKLGLNTYEVHLSGYGGEIVVGSITPEQYQYWRDHDLDEHCSDWDNEMEVPEGLAICRDGSWHECDDIAHETGVEFSDLCYITVYDSQDRAVWQSSMGVDELEKHGIESEGFANDEIYVRYDSTATHAFMAQSIEKGTFFTGEFEVLGKFDPAKLSFRLVDVEGWCLVSGVSYASQEIDDTGGYSTMGKGLEYRVFEVER